MSESDVMVILVNFNNHLDTVECVESLGNSSYENFEICIVDNCSNDESILYFISEFSLNEVDFKDYRHWIGSKYDIKVHLFENHGNFGFASANNIGVTFARSQFFKFVWILNNDTVVFPETLGSLVSNAEFSIRNGRNVAIGARMISYFTNDFDSDGFGYLNLLTSQTSHMSEYIFQLKYLVASSLFLSVSSKLPLMDDRFFLYYEDVDYSIQLSKVGYDLIFDPCVIVKHKISASTKLKENIERVKIQSMILFFKKNYPFLLPILVVVRLFYYVFRRRYKYLWFFLRQL